MDRIKQASDVLIKLTGFRKKLITETEIIRTICSFFDSIKSESITQGDLKFLKYIANYIGIPHYYDLLSKFQQSTEITHFDLNTMAAILYESSLHLNDDTKVHRYQKQVLDSFTPYKRNRYFLSASTSFGKTYLVFEVIRRMKYNNVVLIFPTIALLAENLEKLYSNFGYSDFLQKYSIHTLSEVTNFSERNLFIYTPERFLSYIEKSGNAIKLDFVFVDEAYKMDNEYLIEDQLRENERDLAYRLAVFYALANTTDILLAGPYIDFAKQLDQSSFGKFLDVNEITLLDYNSIEIVNKHYKAVADKGDGKFDDNLDFKFKSKNKDKMFFDIVNAIDSIDENAIVYCALKREVNSFAKKIIKSPLFLDHDTTPYDRFLNHISERFRSDWSLISALKRGVGIHHGLVPKYIQKEIISLFNQGFLKVLICTTTITEGVNTTAKNLLVISSHKGNKPLKKFDAKNISGRAGRFMQHYSGRVISLQNNFMDVIDADAKPIEHKNYDSNSIKDEVDLYYTSDEFLSELDKKKKRDIDSQQATRELPDYIFNQYSVINKSDKMVVYDGIKALSPQDFKKLETLAFTVTAYSNISLEGFQIILDIVRPVVRNKKLQDLIDFKVRNEKKNQSFSLLTSIIIAYFNSGFKGSVEYWLRREKNIDTAIGNAADFIYNTLKYQVVKFIGVFNLMYIYHISQVSDIDMADVPGFQRLLVKLEYNAVTEEGRIANDYGVPSAIVDYYENSSESKNILARFDAYESSTFKRVDDIIQKAKGKT